MYTYSLCIKYTLHHTCKIYKHLCYKSYQMNIHTSYISTD